MVKIGEIMISVSQETLRAYIFSEENKKNSSGLSPISLGVGLCTCITHRVYIYVYKSVFELVVDIP